MTSHVYIFDKELRQQNKGGPIGNSLGSLQTCLWMAWYDKELSKRTEELRIELRLYKRYVDDINTGMLSTPLGATVDGGTLRIDDTTAERDATKNNDERTMELFKQLGNTIHPSIQLEVEYPSKYDDNKIPILDLKIWIEEVETTPGQMERQIMYEHYVKPVSTKAVIYNKSALSSNIKRTVATQEILRILLNCSVHLSEERVAEHVNEMTRRLQMCGYGKKFRHDVVRSALNAHSKLKKEEEEGKRPVHRPKNWNRKERAKTKKKKKCYQKQGYDATLFIPSTPSSNLKKTYKTIIDSSGIRIDIVERQEDQSRQCYRDQTLSRKRLVAEHNV